MAGEAEPNNDDLATAVALVGTLFPPLHEIEEENLEGWDHQETVWI